MNGGLKHENISRQRLAMEAAKLGQNMPLKKTLDRHLHSAPLPVACCWIDSQRADLPRNEDNFSKGNRTKGTETGGRRLGSGNGLELGDSDVAMR